MKKRNPHEKNISTTCDVCEQPVLVDQFGGGRCGFCGWNQTSIDRPDEIHWSYNFVSFNKAKQLVKAGKPVKPDFDDFLKCMQVYSELEFYYSGKQYGLLFIDGNYHFYEWNVMDKGYQEYASVEDFSANANINGILLREVWESVENVGVAS